MYDASYEVKERNLIMAVVYSFVTFGIYSLYWLYQLQKDTNRLLGLRNEPSPATVLILSIVTLGLYTVYWAYRQGVKFRNEAQSRGSAEANDCPSLYLVLQLFNYLIGVTYIVNQALMQDRINQLLRMRGQGTRPYDPDRFNHSPEADIAQRYKDRAAAYEADLAEDEEMNDALATADGKRSLFLTGAGIDSTSDAGTGAGVDSDSIDSGSPDDSGPDSGTTGGTN